jgi:hypothetical protein
MRHRVQRYPILSIYKCHSFVLKIWILDNIGCFIAQHGLDMWLFFIHSYIGLLLLPPCIQSELIDFSLKKLSNIQTTILMGSQHPFADVGNYESTERYQQQQY